VDLLSRNYKCPLPKNRFELSAIIASESPLSSGEVWLPFYVSPEIAAMEMHIANGNRKAKPEI